MSEKIDDLPFMPYPSPELATHQRSLRGIVEAGMLPTDTPARKLLWFIAISWAEEYNKDGASANGSLTETEFWEMMHEAFDVDLPERFEYPESLDAGGNAN